MVLTKCKMRLPLYVPLMTGITSDAVIPLFCSASVAQAKGFKIEITVLIDGRVNLFGAGTVPGLADRRRPFTQRKTAS